MHTAHNKRYGLRQARTFTTYGSSLTSMPRAAMSVLMRKRRSPDLNASRLRRRSSIVRACMQCACILNAVMNTARRACTYERQPVAAHSHQPTQHSCTDSPCPSPCPRGTSGHHQLRSRTSPGCHSQGSCCSRGRRTKHEASTTGHAAHAAAAQRRGASAHRQKMRHCSMRSESMSDSSMRCFRRLMPSEASSAQRRVRGEAGSESRA